MYFHTNKELPFTTIPSTSTYIYRRTDILFMDHLCCVCFHANNELPFTTIPSARISRIAFQDHLCYRYFQTNRSSFSGPSLLQIFPCEQTTSFNYHNCYEPRIPFVYHICYMYFQANREFPFKTISDTTPFQYHFCYMVFQSNRELPFRTISATYGSRSTKTPLSVPFLLHVLSRRTENSVTDPPFPAQLFPGEQRIPFKNHISYMYFRENRNSPFRTISVPLFPCEQRIFFQNNIFLNMFLDEKKLFFFFSNPSPLHVLLGKQRIAVKLHSATCISR